MSPPSPTYLLQPTADLADDACHYERQQYDYGEYFSSENCGLCQCHGAEGVRCPPECPPVVMVLPSLECPDPQIRKEGCCDTLHCNYANLSEFPTLLFYIEYRGRVKRRPRARDKNVLNVMIANPMVYAALIRVWVNRRKNKHLVNKNTLHPFIFVWSVEKWCFQQFLFSARFLPSIHSVSRWQHIKIVKHQSWIRWRDSLAADDERWETIM